MGMFDEMAITCPGCGHVNIVQTKGGPCQLRTFSLDSAPEGCFDDREVQKGPCSKCGEAWRIVPVVATTYQVKLLRELKEDAKLKVRGMTDRAVVIMCDRLGIDGDDIAYLREALEENFTD